MHLRYLLPNLFLFLEGQMHQILYPYVYIHFHATESLKQYLKMKLNTLLTKYIDTDILIFNFAHINYPQRCIMSLYVSVY